MTEKEIIQKIYEVIKLVDCIQYNPFVDFNYLRAKGAYNIIKNQVEHIEAENTELRARLEKAVVLTPEERAEEMRLANEERKQAVKEFAERVKMAFYYEFDELIPSTMADKIDELIEEVCGDD